MTTQLETLPFSLKELRDARPLPIFQGLIVSRRFRKLVERVYGKPFEFGGKPVIESKYLPTSATVSWR